MKLSGALPLPLPLPLPLKALAQPLKANAVPLDPKADVVHAPFNPWAAIVTWVVQKVRRIPGLSIELIIGASTIVSSLAVLGACVGLIVLTYVLVYILRPRLFTISHSIAFESYMTDTTAEIAAVMQRVHGAISSGALDSVLSMGNGALDRLSSCGDSASSRETVRTVANRVSSVLAGLVARQDLQGDVMRNFQFDRSMSSMKIDMSLKPPEYAPNMLARMDFKSDPIFQNDETGEADVPKVVKFHDDVYLPMTALRTDAVTLSSRLSAACALKSTPAVSRSIMDIHLLRLHLDVYHDQTAMSCETRKTGPGRLPTAIMTLFWWESVKPIYEKSIPAMWKATPTAFRNLVIAYGKAWDALGPKIAMLPCHMAHTEMAKDARIAKCGNIEGFSIGALVNGLITMITGSIDMVLSIAILVMGIADDPFGGIMKIFMLIVGLLFGLIINLLYMIVSLSQLYWLPGVWYAWNISFGLSITLTVWEVLFTMLLAIPYGILTLCDLVTAGAVMHLLRCETLPSDWVTQPNTAFSNIRERFGPMCAVPCVGKGFVPSYGGVGCSCLPLDTPPFCPQQQLFRAFRSLPLGDPWIFDGFTADSKFMSSNPDDQQQLMATAYQRKTGFLGRCYSATSPYSFVTRHVCSNLDAILPSDVTSEDKARLALLCHQVYCNFGPSPGDDPSSHADDLSGAPDAVMLTELAPASFCSDAPRVIDESQDNSKVTSNLSRAVLLTALATCMALVILYAVLG